MLSPTTTFRKEEKRKENGEVEKENLTDKIINACINVHKELVPFQDSSYPRNELLVDVFFKAGFIESCGRGTIKIVEKCRQFNLPEPEFSEMTGDFLITFFKGQKTTRQNGLPETMENILGEKVGERLGVNESKILHMILVDKFVTIHSIAESVGISTTAVEKKFSKTEIKRYSTSHWPG